jgi:hypothetical protein
MSVAFGEYPPGRAVLSCWSYSEPSEGLSEEGPLVAAPGFLGYSVLGWEHRTWSEHRSGEGRTVRSGYP